MKKYYVSYVWDSSTHQTFCDTIYETKGEFNPIKFKEDLNNLTIVVLYVQEIK